VTLASVQSVLAHPLVVLAAGTALTGFLVPRLTERRQRSLKALELKTELVEQMTEEVTSFVMAIQFAELGAAGQTQEEFDAAYKRWEVAAAVIRARLEAYFGDHPLVADWAQLADILTRFYALAGTHDEDQRGADLTRLLAREGVAPEEAEQHPWGRLKDAVLHHSQRISREILASRDMALGGVDRSRRWSQRGA
jgi:hypothetical protein